MEPYWALHPVLCPKEKHTVWEKDFEPGCSSRIIDTGETCLLKWMPVLITRTRQSTLSKKKNIKHHLFSLPDPGARSGLGSSWYWERIICLRRSAPQRWLGCCRCEALLPRGGWAAVDVRTWWLYYKASLTQPRKLPFFPASFLQSNICQANTQPSSQLEGQSTLRLSPACLIAHRHRRRMLGRGDSQNTLPRGSWDIVLTEALGHRVKRERPKCTLSSKKSSGGIEEGVCVGGSSQN